MGLLTWIWNGITSLGGMILPVFAKARDVRGLGRKLRWVIHFTLIAIILGLLGFLNYAFDVEKLLTPPAPFLGKIWLPLLFLVIYLLSWLGWWLWTLLSTEEAVSDFPDVDEAWDEAVQALNQARINVAEVPLFLLLGRPEGTEKALFEGAQLELTVSNAPDRLESPLRVFGNKDGIFVTCAGASVLGKQAELLATPVPTPGAPAARAEGADVSIARAGPAGGGESIATSVGDASLSAPAAVEDKGESIAVSVSDRIPPPVAARAAPRAMLLKDTAEVERLTARLRRLCWRILKDRRPYCPINGVLLLLPYAASATDTEANQTGLICQRDLEAIRGVLQINCPVLALVTDMEKAVGFRDFIDRFPKGHRQRRLGQQFPFVGGLNPGDRTQLIETGVDWICSELFPSLIFRLMRPDRTRERGQTAIRTNVRLFGLLSQIRERRKRLSRILALGLDLSASEPVYFGGVYFAGTGRNATREQAFIAAVFHRLLEAQNYVSWTTAGMGEEHDYRRWSVLGYTALGIFLVALVLFGYFFILH